MEGLRKIEFARCNSMGYDFAFSTSGVVVQLVRTPACHAGGREFESRRPRHIFNELQLVTRRFKSDCDITLSKVRL
jgi:hypothetical protein